MKINYSIAQNLQYFEYTIPSTLIAIPLFWVHESIKKKLELRITAVFKWASYNQNNHSSQSLKGTDNQGNQSRFEVITCSWRKVREKEWKWVTWAVIAVISGITCKRGERVKRPFSMYQNTAEHNRRQHEALGNKPQILQFFPRASYWGLLFNFNIPTLVFSALY